MRGPLLGAMREGIARHTGILVKQQRLIVLGEPTPAPQPVAVAVQQLACLLGRWELLEEGRSELLHRAKRGFGEPAGRVGRVAQLCACAATERSGPGAQSHLTNSLFLQALTGMAGPAVQSPFKIATQSYSAWRSGNAPR